MPTAAHTLLPALLLLTVGCQRTVTFEPGSSEAHAYALEILERNARSGDPEDVFRLVFHRDYMMGDRETGVDSLLRLAEGGNPYAASMLGGVIYQHDDRGAERDFEEAARWLRVAAERGIEGAAEDVAAYEAWKATGSPETSGDAGASGAE